MAPLSQNISTRSTNEQADRSANQASGRLFGVPLGDLGLFTSLLMSFALGFAAFFASTFCAIVGMLFYSSVTHRAIDYTRTYRDIGLPVGLVVLALALGYLGTLWIRRRFRR